MTRRVLLIDAEESAAQRAQDMSRDGDPDAFAVERVGLCADAIARLAAEPSLASASGGAIDAVVVNLTLPDSAGIDTFERVFRAAPHIPIIVLCAAADEALARIAIKRGAQDYLLTERVDGYSLAKAVHVMVERASTADALFEQTERAQITLDSIADGVISTDVAGRVTFLNAVAQRLTGWSAAEAAGRALDDVFHIVDGTARVIAQQPMTLAIRRDAPASLAPNCVLIRRDGQEFPIEDSAAPIHDRKREVTGAVMVFRDVTNARQLVLRIAHQARHDDLTNLPNRALMNEQLVKAAALAHRNDHMMAVLFLDIDRFKYINDSLGHDIGDRLLQSVAQRLLSCVRGSDTVSRHGGDEFSILLAQVAQARDAAVFADKILRQLSEPHRIDEHELHVTVSIGIATSPADGLDARSLLKNADLAMYHAKNQGRNNYQFFRSEMNTRLMARRSMELELSRAIENDEFALFFQPTIQLATRAITGVEALLRWRHPEHGLLLPEQFLPLAEESGQIVPIGRWVLRDACRQARSWQDACLPPMRIAVNVSARELRGKDFAAGVEAILRAAGLEPNCLMIELTETMLLRDLQATAWVLHDLKALGIQIALDDFGTGFSSLSHLQKFPIDALKIDQSFLWNLTADSGDASIVGAVIGMADGLRMRVIAEGVENRTQLAVLEEQSCPEAQGYLFSRPLPASELAEFLRHAHLTQDMHREPVGPTA